MASRKNRSRKANRRSPKAPPTLRERLQQRFNAVVTWVGAHHWHAIVGGLVLLFVASLFGGYWIAERLESGDRDRLARDTLGGDEAQHARRTGGEIRAHRGPARPAEIH